MGLILLYSISVDQMGRVHTLDIVNRPGPSSRWAVRVNGLEHMICEKYSCPRSRSLEEYGDEGRVGAKVLLEYQEGSYLAKRWEKNRARHRYNVALTGFCFGLRTNNCMKRFSAPGSNNEVWRCFIIKRYDNIKLQIYVKANLTSETANSCLMIQVQRHHGSWMLGFNTRSRWFWTEISIQHSMSKVWNRIRFEKKDEYFEFW